MRFLCTRDELRDLHRGARDSGAPSISEFIRRAAFQAAHAARADDARDVVQHIGNKARAIARAIGERGSNGT